MGTVTSFPTHSLKTKFEKASMNMVTMISNMDIRFNFFGVIPMVFGIIMTPFWSAFTEAWTKKDFDWIKNTMKKLNLISILLIIVTMFMLAFSNFVFKLWVGKDVTVPISISIVLAAYFIINAS